MDFYELRYRRSAAPPRFEGSARRETIPATIRELTNAQCLELQLIENLQRADVHELDEARGYAALLASFKQDTYTRRDARRESRAF